MENQDSIDVLHDSDPDYYYANDDNDSLNDYNTTVNDNTKVDVNSSNIRCAYCPKSFPPTQFLPNSKSARRSIILETADTNAPLRKRCLSCRVKQQDQDKERKRKRRRVEDEKKPHTTFKWAMLLDWIQNRCIIAILSC